jgi:hypothetical protein
MRSSDNKIFWSIIVFSIILLIYGMIGQLNINKDPVYIFGKITSITSAKQTRLSYEFTYNMKTHSGSMTASAQGLKVGDYYMIKFQKSNPSNFRPIFDKDSWRCLLKDSSYYYGSPKKPDCEY